MHLNKKGIRALGIAESFVRKRPRSVLAGVVMRSDLIIDGFAFTEITVGGMDATDGIIKIFNSLERSDINVIMLNGCVISWFNVVNLNKIYEETGIPLICVTYEASEGLEPHFRRHFDGEDLQKRLDAYRMLGERVPVRIKGKHEQRKGKKQEILIRILGLEKSGAVQILRKFTLHGRIPEPLRVARLCARSLLRSSFSHSSSLSTTPTTSSSASTSPLFSRSLSLN